MEKALMTNLEKYTKVFMEVFNVTEEEATGLTYQGIPAWDSVGHMTLIAGLEDAFDIILDTDDIIDLNSFDEGKERLKKYDVVIE
jgi:acyl carrier protein